MFGFFKKNNKREVDGQWQTVAELKVGQSIAVPKEDVLNMHSAGKLGNSSPTFASPDGRASSDKQPSYSERGEPRQEENDILWDEIESIEYKGTEQVWDIEVEGTHNFIGNNIFAHNTYITGGNLGVGSSTPFANISVGGSGVGSTLLALDALTGQTAPIMDIKLASTSKFVIDNTGNVGIGINSPTALLTLQGAGTAKDLFKIASTTNGLPVLTITQWGGFVQKVASTSALSIQMASGTPVFEVDTTSNTNSGIDITAGTGQTTNLLNFFSSGSSFLSGFTSAGGLFMNISSTTAMNVYDGSGNAAFVLNSTGKSLGIGTSTLTYNLNVAGSQASSYIARIDNAATNNTADGLLISLGVANASRGTGNYFIGFANGAQTVAGKIQGGANAVAYTTTAADLAEYFQVADIEDMPVSGEIVALDLGNENKVKKALGESGMPVGIVSTNPGFIGNGPICPIDERDCDANYEKYNVLVAMAGQVPVKVTDENGKVKTGDFLTISKTVAGAAAKMIEGGYSVGVALNDATASEDSVSLVTAFVRNEWRSVESLSQIAGEVGGEDLQSATSTGVLLSNQRGEGHLLQLQQNGIDKLIVRGDGSIVTYGNLEVTGIILAGRDTAGSATVEAGEAGTQVVFEKPYPGAPIIIITPQGLTDAQYAVTEKDGDGFKIVLNKPAAGNLEFNWIAVYQPQPSLYLKIGLPEGGDGGQVAGVSTSTPETTDETAISTPEITGESGGGEVIPDPIPETVPTVVPTPIGTNIPTPTPEPQPEPAP